MLNSFVFSQKKQIFEASKDHVQQDGRLLSLKLATTQKDEENDEKTQKNRRNLTFGSSLVLSCLLGVARADKKLCSSDIFSKFS